MLQTHESPSFLRGSVAVLGKGEAGLRRYALILSLSIRFRCFIFIE